MACTTCNGRRHTWDAEHEIWLVCDCVSRAKDTEARARSGVVGEARPVSDFGPHYGKFVREALSSAVPALLIGDHPFLMEAAQSALEVAVLTERKARLVRLVELVDVAFDREKKAKLLTGLRGVEVLVVVCGDESDHKWNGTMLYEVVSPRRLSGKPTIVAATGDLSMYGEKGTACFRGLPKYPTFKLLSHDD